MYGFLLLSYSNFVRKVLEIFDFKNAVTLKPGLRVREGHWKCHHSIESLFNVEKYRDFEILVKGHSRSLNVAQFDRLGMISY